MIGQSFNIEDQIFTFTEEIAVERPNADVYLCEDNTGKKFIAKYFCTGIPRPVVGFSIYNHYGRRRDGSYQVFEEIKEKSEIHDFIVKYHYRIRYNGSWLVIMDFIEGSTLRDFIMENHNKLEMVIPAVSLLAEALAEWHNHGFAHGDPHLENAILTPNDKVKFIDYGQIHHYDFEYCDSYCCIENGKLIRIAEDFENYSGKLGHGFRADLVSISEELNLGKLLIEAFNKSYQKHTTLDIFDHEFFS